MIAEIGVNHEGDVEVAANIIKALSGSGAAAVKFQSYTPERFVSASDPEKLARAESFSLSLNEHKFLRECARKAGLAFISTPCSEDWVEKLVGICDAIKIASGDINFQPTIKLAAQSGLPVIMSTGAANTKEVDEAVSLFKSCCGSSNLKNALLLMHCVSEYPASLEGSNMLSIPFMMERYGLKVGWSNHVIGSHACYTAVALGADVIEVHVTNNKCGRQFRDHALSFEPHEIRNLVNDLKSISNGLGDYDKMPTNSETKNIDLIRKGLIYSRSLDIGEELTSSDIQFARPATHFSSSQIKDVLGLKLTKSVKIGHSIRADDFDIK